MWVRKLLALACLSAVVLHGPTATGDFVPIGDPNKGNSWSQAFQETGVGLFDLVAVRIVSGGPFDSPTHRSFNRAGWATVYEQGGASPTLGTAVGPSTTNLIWRIHFESDMPEPLEFDFVAFRGNTLLEEANAKWDGAAWTIRLSNNWNPTRNMLLPLPMPAAIACAGLGGVLFTNRRRRQVA
ncbi:MAG: hypothetical protein ACF8PN_07860 [Phycisphaerales bacterium]